MSLALNVLITSYYKSIIGFQKRINFHNSDSTWCGTTWYWLWL